MAEPPTRTDENEDDLGEEDAPIFPGADAPSVLPTTAQQSLTFFNCLSIVLGIQIGSGIFSTPAVISTHVSTPIAGVLVWTFAGLLVWTGASCFAELGTLISTNGGMQEYLRAGYGDLAGFLCSSVWLAIVRPCTIAIIALIFADHIVGLLLQRTETSGVLLLQKVIALIGVWTVAVINCLGVKTGAKVAGWFLILKLTMIVSIIIAGIYECIDKKGGYLFTGADEHDKLKDIGVWNAMGEYVTALLTALWVCGGWETVGFVAGEMKNPARDIPYVLNSAMTIVVTGFTLTSAAFYVVLPIAVVRENNTPAITFANALYGRVGFLLYTTAISLSALGAVNSNIFAISRLVISASQRNYIPSFFAPSDHGNVTPQGEGAMIRHSLTTHMPHWLIWCIVELSSRTWHLRVKEKVPVYAMLLTAILTSVYILTGTFQALLTFIGIVEYIIFMSTVLVLPRLRRNLSKSVVPPQIGSYRTYTANIVLFCGLSCFLVVRGIVTEPIQGLILLLVLGGLLLIWRWKQQIE